MDKEELDILINITLEKELDDLQNKKSTYYLKTTDGKHAIIFEHSDTLIDIFSNIQLKSLKEEFVKILENQVINSTDIEIFVLRGDYIYASTSSLCFYTLVKLGFIDRALNALNKRTGYQISGNIFLLIYYMLNEDCTYFNLKELSKLIEIIKIQSSGSRVYAQMHKQRVLSILRTSAYEIAKKSTKGINLEINKDKKEVETIIKYLEFDEKYNKLLSEIDFFINTESQILSSGMIGNLRSFMEDLLSDLAKKIASKEKEEIPKDDTLGHMGNIRKYLKIKLELSDNDNKFINNFIDILHAEGGHSFVSNKEYFRLARNIGIEIVLLLLSKYNFKYKTG